MKPPARQKSSTASVQAKLSLSSPTLGCPASPIQGNALFARPAAKIFPSKSSLAPPPSFMPSSPADSPLSHFTLVASSPPSQAVAKMSSPLPPAATTPPSTLNPPIASPAPFLPSPKSSPPPPASASAANLPKNSKKCFSAPPLRPPPSLLERRKARSLSCSRLSRKPALNFSSTRQPFPSPSAYFGLMCLLAHPYP